MTEFKPENKCFWCGLPNDYEKELKCACCGQLFMAKHKRAKSIAGVLIGNCTLTKYCDKCLKLIDATQWFMHHRKEPTFIELKKEIENLTKHVAKMVTEEEYKRDLFSGVST